MSLIERFFDPTRGMDPCKESDYRKMKYYRHCADTMADLEHQSFYIIDYFKRTFHYVSENPLFLCGHPADEVKKMGFDYFERVIPPDDLKMLLEISDKAFAFFFKLPVETRTKCSIEYDFRMKQPDGMLLLVNHKLKPLLLTRDDYLWMALCEVRLSTNTSPGNVVIMLKDENQKYEYSFACQRFKLCETLPLTVREREVVGLLVKGLTVKAIAARLFITPNTVKYHRTNIYKKLGVQNKSQLIQWVNGREMGR